MAGEERTGEAACLLEGPVGQVVFIIFLRAIGGRMEGKGWGEQEV